MAMQLPGPGPGGDRARVKLSQEAIVSAAEGMTGKIDEVVVGATLKSPRPVIEEDGGHYHLHFALRDSPDPTELVEIMTLLEGQGCSIEMNSKEFIVYHVPARVIASYVEWA